MADRDRPLGAWGIGPLSSKSPACNLIGYDTGKRLVTGQGFDSFGRAIAIVAQSNHL
ncbi:hypothetical protein QUB56_03925 [Microcoleus sp. AR_TQ3_B6]|uniref:hypothetical protein n=1 Tax=Microcoleus sp. AR_TQ3_B6 TaxID=3055284 RepID=UPI002FD2DD36